MKLTSQDIANYQERGYWIPDAGLFHAVGFHSLTETFEAWAHDAVRKSLCDAVHIPQSNNGLLKIDNFWKCDKKLWKFPHKEVGKIAAQLLQTNKVLLWQDQYTEKPPGGEAIVFHQDWAWWQMIDRPNVVTCWIALDEVTEDMGPPVYLEGSHKDGFKEGSLGRVGEGLERVYPEIPLIVKAGHCGFHHGLTFHGSGPNISDTTRRCLILHMMSGDCRYRQMNEHTNEFKMREYSVYPQDGELFVGPQFPVLWEG